MRRVEAGRPFRLAYREVATALEAGERFPAPGKAALLARRRSTGGLGNLGLLGVGGAAPRRATLGRAAADPVRSRDAGAGGPPPESARPPMTADRKKRLLRIMEIISTRAVRTQEELVEILNAEGWDVTQSSVSRDVAALRLAKVEGAYRRPAPASERGRSRRAADRRGGAGTRPGGGRAAASCTRRPAKPIAWPSRSTGWPGPRSSEPSRATIRSSSRCATGSRRSRSPAIFGCCRRRSEKGDSIGAALSAPIHPFGYLGGLPVPPAWMPPTWSKVTPTPGRPSSKTA